jgi:lysozyme family protein
MSAGNYVLAEPRILVYEGGKVNNPRDPGGKTNLGVTQYTFTAWLRSHGYPAQDVYTITPSQVLAIYEEEYWNRINGDKLPGGVDFAVFDASVNSGVGQAGKWLQHALGDHYVGVVDGMVGNKTLQAVEDFGDPEALVNAICSRRLATLKSLSTWSTFGKGWSGRIANVQKTGDAWAAGDEAPHPVDVTSAGGHQKAVVAGNIKPSPVSQMQAHALALGSTVVGSATTAATNLTPVADTLGWVKYAAAGLTVTAVIGGMFLKFANDAKTQAASGAAEAEVDTDADKDFPTVPVVAAVQSTAKT